MTETNAQETKVEPVVPMAINTPFATIAVYGHEHMAKRDMEVLATLLSNSDKDFGIRMMLFRTDGYPKGQIANCCPDTMSIAINLDKLLGDALEYTLEHPEHSAFAKFYLDLMFAYYHEAGHLEPRLIASDREQMDNDDAADEENRVNLWATDQLLLLAKSHNVEPPLAADCLFLSTKIAAVLHDMLEDASPEDQAWGRKQLEMLASRVFYHLPAGERDGQAYNELTLHNFRSYVAIAFGQDPDDAEWNQPVNDTPTLVESMNAAQDEPTDEPPVEIVATAAADMSANANTLFIQDVQPDSSIYADDFGYHEYTDLPQMETPQQAVAAMAADRTMGAASSPGQNLFMSKTFTPTVPAQAPENVAPPVEANIPVYPNNGLSEEQVAALVNNVYGKIYNHMFTNCQWQLQNDVGFLRPEAVAEIPIQLTDQEKAVVVKCDCLNPDGKFTPNTPTTMGLRGYIAKNAKLPMYRLFINVGGNEVCRLLMPQNPSKKDNGGAYTKQALAARGGSAIMYIMEGNDNVAAATGKKYLFKFVDGQLNRC